LIQYPLSKSHQYILNTKKMICLGLFLGLCFFAKAQDSPDKHKADEYYQRALKSLYANDPQKVIEYSYQAIDALPTWNKPYLLIGNIYEHQMHYADALAVYDKLLKNVPTDFDGLMSRADMELQLEKYDSAQTDYQTAASQTDVPAKAHNAALDHVERMKYIRYLVAHPVPFEPENLGPNVNSKDDEYFPAFTVDGQTMYFTRKKILGTKQSHGMNFTEMNEDIMMSKWENGQWSAAVDIPGPIDTPDGDEGAMSIAPDGTYLIFTRCKGSCDLFISFLINDEWTNPVNMGEPINTRYNEKQTSISADGRTIYFSSDRPGGLGGLDIWSSTHDDHWNFSQPVNLGSTINTKEDDQFPFIHPDDQTLYFISRGHKGMGKDDIFYAHRNDVSSPWDSAVNIGYPINTPGYEPGIVIDRTGDYAYFSSERAGGFGKLDLYRFKLPKNAKPKPVTYLKAHIIDADTKKPLEGDLELIDLETAKSFLKATASAKGDVEAVLPSGKDYMVNVSDSGYLFYSDNIPLKNYVSTKPFETVIELKPIRKGEKINLKNVFFPSDGFTLEDKSKSELNKLASFMITNPAVKLEISGHTDNSGKPAHNQELSEKRAKAVYDYMVGEGKIPATRLSYKGYGDTQPIAPNTTDAGKKLNRRTEVTVNN